VARGHCARDESSTERDSTIVATVASLLLTGGTMVIATENPAQMFDDAMHMLPAGLRSQVDAAAGLRFSPSRGVRVTLTDAIDQETIRATRGQAIECIELATKQIAIAAPLAPWLSLVSRWWNEGRRAEADDLADRVGRGWTIDKLKDVAVVCEAIDRRAMTPEALGDLLARRSAA
jgi:hypothetical protein